MQLFDLTKDERLKLWQELSNLLEDYYSNTSALRVAPLLDRKAVVKLVEKYDFGTAVSAEEAINHVIGGIKKYGVQTPHPS